MGGGQREGCEEKKKKGKLQLEFKVNKFLFKKGIEKSDQYVEVYVTA